MEKYNCKSVQFHNIIIAFTTRPDYEMNRWLLLEDMEDLRYDEYVVVDGYHCSCYDFDETKWEAIKYNEEELIKVAKDRTSNDCFSDEEKTFYKLVLNYFGR